MVKKINEFGATALTLLKQGYSQSWIAHQLKIKRQRVNYWASHSLKTQQFKKNNYQNNISRGLSNSQEIKPPVS